jgi:hypothetical protein
MRCSWQFKACVQACGTSQTSHPVYILGTGWKAQVGQSAAVALDFLRDYMRSSSKRSLALQEAGTH